MAFQKSLSLRLGLPIYKTRAQTKTRGHSVRLIHSKMLQMLPFFKSSLRSHSMTFLGYQCHGRCESPIRKKKCPVNADPQTRLACPPRGRSSEGKSPTWDLLCSLLPAAPEVFLEGLTPLKWALEQSRREGKPEGIGRERGARVAPHPNDCVAARANQDENRAASRFLSRSLRQQSLLRLSFETCP